VNGVLFEHFKFREDGNSGLFLLFANEGLFFFFFDKPKASTFRANLKVFRVVGHFAVAITFDAEEHPIFFRIKMVIHVNSHFPLPVFLLPNGLAIAYSSKLDSQ
jgi:hypothetical protein